MKDGLKEIIRSNIEWFWNNDPLVENEANIDNLWVGYKLFCLQNCTEVLEEVPENQIIQKINDMYDEWLEAR